CANRCGKKGERYIHAHGHIRMMAACQPFLSGAISKTINLPHEATIEEIADAYMLSWQLSLKACALYRDGSKLSQPLSNKSEKKKKKSESKENDKMEEKQLETGNSKLEAVSLQTEPNIVDLSKLTAEDLLEEVHKRMQASNDTSLKRKLSQIVERKTLPAKRRGFTQKAKINGQVLFLRTGEYNDGTLGEIFIDLAKEGSTLRSLMNCFAIAISVGLQYGVPLDEFVEKFVFTKFEPAGMVDHPNIKTTTSLVDFVFRALAYEYLGRTDLVHVIDKPEISNVESNEDVSMLTKPALSNVHVHVHTSSQKQKAAVTSAIKSEAGLDAVNAAAKSMQSDAPSCNVCGHITVRSGTCYKCLNCGNSMGCS
ncbi:MAG TPA: vitamin B12-dependent ribonucleotide reductase, partial [Chitinophagaceae bacterium]